LTLKLADIVARGVSKLPINFGVSRTFRSRLIGQHLSDASRDLATLIFDLGGHGALIVADTRLRAPSVYQVSTS